MVDLPLSPEPEVRQSSPSQCQCIFSAYPVKESCIPSAAVGSLPLTLRLSRDFASSSPLLHCLASSDKHPWWRLYLEVAASYLGATPQTVKRGIDFFWFGVLRPQGLARQAAQAQRDYVFVMFSMRKELCM